MSSRPEKDLYYLGLASAAARRSTCLRRKYGAVIVKNDEVISTGYNGAPRGELNCDEIGSCPRELNGIPKGERYELCRSVHAEMNCIISAKRSDMEGATIYISGSDVQSREIADCTPCLICRKLIVNAGIVRAVGYDKTGEVTDLSIADPYQQQ